MNTFWNERRVFLTGSGGFLGRALRQRLASRSPAVLLTPRSSELNLLNVGAVRQYLEANRPDVVIHAAGVVGGIGANREHPARFFFDNAAMGIHLIEECRRSGVEKFVCVGTVCAYPKFASVPFREDDLWNGYPEETNAPYGLAKKMLLVQLQAYRAEYGFRGIYVLPTNLYGPGDNFDPDTSHVIPAMIHKFLDAVDQRTDEVVLWGDGSPTRDFLYVDDAADAIVTAAEIYDEADPINFGTGREVSIREVAETIAKLTGFHGRIRWDTSRPNGQPRRSLDSTRAQQKLGFQPRTSFVAGLQQTIDWFDKERH